MYVNARGGYDGRISSSFLLEYSMWALICLIGFIVLLFSASSSQRPRTKTSQEEQEAMLKRLKREDEMRRRMEYPEQDQGLAIWKNGRWF